MDHPFVPSGDGIPGGWTPRIVVRPGALLSAFTPSFAAVGQSQSSPRFGRLRTAHLLWIAAAVFVLEPLRMAYALGGTPADIGLVATVALLAGLFALAWRTLQLTWDGRQAVLRSFGRQKVLATPGVGQIVRVRPIGRNIDIGYTQYWLDPAGKVRGRFPERQWDPAVLARIAAEARLPVVDAGALSYKDLSLRYPTIMPRLAAALAPPPKGSATKRFGLSETDLVRVMIVGIAVVAVVAGMLRGHGQ